MARMYPKPLDPNTKSDAERALYAAFRDKLDESYTVFHSVAWQSLDRSGRPRDGEADFVIAHPQLGILVMEAKGGVIRHDPSTGDWTSLDRADQAHPIRDPFGQARNSMYVLLYPLLEMTGQPRNCINIGHVVAFPDVVLGDDLLGLDKPRQIILDATDLADLSGWVRSALTYWYGTKERGEMAPGEQLLQALMDLLGKAWELRPAMWGEFVQEREQLIHLTGQQYLILDALSRQRRAAICGCAGSGKTMLAVEKASRLARQGFRVLLTCFNRHLAADLRARIGNPQNLDIAHFHGLCYDLVQKANLMPVKENDHAFYDWQLPQALQDAAGKLGVHYDAIVVDEGQDFLEGWWIPLQTLLRDPEEGILYVFYDDNQRLYTRRSAFPIQGEPYLLTVNCRNTQSIHRVVTQFYDAETRPTAGGPAGREVEIVYYDLAHPLRATLQATLLQLTQDERIPTAEIAVLTPLRERSQLWQQSPVEIPLTSTWPPPPNQVYCTTIYDFKGLESAVIVLAELEGWLGEFVDLEPLLYVGCSRARNHLVVLLPRSADPAIRRAFLRVQ